jgi:hypothetical protein
MAMPTAREPGPLVTRWRIRTVAKVHSIGGVEELLDRLVVRPDAIPVRVDVTD